MTWSRFCKSMPLDTKSDATKILSLPLEKDRSVWARLDVFVEDVNVPMRGARSGERISNSRESRRAASLDFVKIRTVLLKFVRLTGGATLPRALLSFGSLSLSLSES